MAVPYPESLAVNEQMAAEIRRMNAMKQRALPPEKFMGTIDAAEARRIECSTDSTVVTQLEK